MNCAYFTSFMYLSLWEAHQSHCKNLIPKNLIFGLRKGGPMSTPSTLARQTVSSHGKALLSLACDKIWNRFSLGIPLLLNRSQHAGSNGLGARSENRTPVLYSSIVTNEVKRKQTTGGGRRIPTHRRWIVYRDAPSFGLLGGGAKRRSRPRSRGALVANHLGASTGTETVAIVPGGEHGI
jgi:hypothetical protein